MRILVFTAALLLPGAELFADQWLKNPTPGIPRTADGRADLSAPAPRTPEGTAEALFRTRVANNAKDDPTSNCIVGGVPRSDFVPYPFKIVETPGLVMSLYEAVHSFRQIFTDGRSLPRDPNPAWFGYSIGRWEGGWITPAVRPQRRFGSWSGFAGPTSAHRHRSRDCRL